MPPTLTTRLTAGAIGEPSTIGWAPSSPFSRENTSRSGLSGSEWPRSRITPSWRSMPSRTASPRTPRAGGPSSTAMSSEPPFSTHWTTVSISCTHSASSSSAVSGGRPRRSARPREPPAQSQRIGDHGDPGVGEHLGPGRVARGQQPVAVGAQQRGEPGQAALAGGAVPVRVVDQDGRALASRPARATGSPGCRWRRPAEPASSTRPGPPGCPPAARQRVSCAPIDSPQAAARARVSRRRPWRGSGRTRRGR